MNRPYNHHEVEPKWQKYWEENETFKTDVWDFSKPKFMHWTCSLIPQAQAFMQVIRKDIQLQIFLQE